MPRTPTDYSKTIIYKIVCNDLTVKGCYVGHTTDMTKRKCEHKSVCHNEKSKKYNRKIYQIIRANGGWDNWNMVLVEKFPCKDNHEACKREREVYEELDAKMNTLIPYRTQEDLIQYKKQYRDEHKDILNEKGRKYKQEHKEEINKNRNEKIECEYCAKLLSKQYMSRHHKTCKSKE